MTYKPFDNPKRKRVTEKELDYVINNIILIICRTPSRQPAVDNGESIIGFTNNSTLWGTFPPNSLRYMFFSIPTSNIQLLWSLCTPFQCDICFSRIHGCALVNN